MPHDAGSELAFLKVRVRITRPMPVREMWALVMRAARSRIVPEGIELLVMNWEKEGKDSGRVRGGQYIGNAAVADALRDMFLLIKAGEVRVRHAE